MEQYVLIGLLIFVVGVVLIALIDAYKTRDILGAYSRLIERLTSNVTLADATDREVVTVLDRFADGVNAYHADLAAGSTSTISSRSPRRSNRMPSS